MTDRLAAVAWSLVIDRLTAAAADILDAAGVPFLLLKGPAVVWAFYRDGEYRRYQDVDLLVPADRWEDALQHLERAGWARPLRDVRPTEQSLGGDHLIFRAADRSVQLDLHLTFHGVRRPERTWEVFSRRPRSIRVGNREVPAPALPVQVSDAGGRLVTDLGLAGCHDVTAALRGPDAPPFALGWLAVLSQPRRRDQLRLLVHKLFPSRALVRMRQAQAGDTGPMVAWHVRRWIRLIAAAPAAIARTRYCSTTGARCWPGPAAGRETCAASTGTPPRATAATTASWSAGGRTR